LDSWNSESTQQNGAHEYARGAKSQHIELQCGVHVYASLMVSAWLKPNRRRGSLEALNTQMGMAVRLRHGDGQEIASKVMIFLAKFRYPKMGIALPGL
jgi:hypothetical protein